MGKSKFWVRSIPAISKEETAANWTMQPLVRDYPGIMGNISAYYGTLSPGSIPHDIHAHDEEEIIVLLSGNLDIISPSSRLCMGAGSFWHHPPRTWHTIQAVGSERANFLVFKWKWEGISQLQPKADFFSFDADKLTAWDSQKSLQRQRVCHSQPLANGGRLVVDVVHIAPHTACAAHIHTHDVAHVILSGEFHAFGYQTAAPAVVYYPVGTPHSVLPQNPEPIEMLAIEFHAPN